MWVLTVLSKPQIIFCTFRQGVAEVEQNQLGVQGVGGGGAHPTARPPKALSGEGERYNFHQVPGKVTEVHRWREQRQTATWPPSPARGIRGALRGQVETWKPHEHQHRTMTTPSTAGHPCG